MHSIRSPAPARAPEISSAMEADDSAVGFRSLPEGCISHVLSLTTPKDTCRSAAAGREFWSAAESDAVWEGFLPADYRDILERADEPVECRSKKELYFRLCEPLLIDNGTKSFKLEKSTGKKCYMLSARDLRIVWGDTPNYWSWGPLPGSRFPEVAQLHSVCWLDISGRLRASLLSPGTKYAAYLVYRLSRQAYGLAYPFQKASITIGPHTSKQEVRLQPREHRSTGDYWVYRRRGHAGPTGHICNSRIRLVLEGLLPDSPDEAVAAAAAAAGGGGEVEEEGGKVDVEGGIPAAQSRNDGWMEIALGEFVVDEGCDGEVEISLLETEGGHWKKGLIVEGIEVRPKK